MNLAEEDISILNKNEMILLKSEKKQDLLQKKALNIINKTGKRLIDIIAGIVGTIMLIPITLIIAIINFFEKDKGPLFFTQKRIGKNGKLFKMYKFRTMIVGADKELERILKTDENARKEYKKNKKLKNDPRITKIGIFLRKTSLDEFPQFINVLKGEMSLVGPRPYLPREQEDIGYYYYYITKCKPGITGLWQARGRSNVDFENRCKLDRFYDEHKGLWFDFKILIWTVVSLFQSKGAK